MRGQDTQQSTMFSYFSEVLDQARTADLLSDEHFSVDGTLIEAWAGQKSFQRKDGGDQTPNDDPGNPTVDFHGEKRSNDTHESTTDPDSQLARKSGGHEAKLAYCGNIIIENRHGLVVDTELLQCNGTAERLEGAERVTLGGDKGYDTKDFVKEMRGMNVTPHVAQNLKRNGGSAIDGRCLQPRAYAESADTSSSARISRGRGAPKIAKWRSWAPSTTYENAILSGFSTGTKLKT